MDKMIFDLADYKHNDYGMYCNTLKKARKGVLTKC